MKGFRPFSLALALPLGLISVPGLAPVALAAPGQPATTALGPLPASSIGGALDVVIVGGGPSPASNQIAIESNVRYVQSLLPPLSRTTVLFADGDKNSRSVIYRPEEPKAQAVDLVLNALFPRATHGHNPRGARTAEGQGGSTQGGAQVPPVQGPTNASPAVISPAVTGAASSGSNNSANQADVPASRGLLKPPALLQLDGPTSHAAIASAVNQTRRSSAAQLLYFTGHGSKTKDNLENNYFNLWGGGKYTVRDLARDITQIPAGKPIVLVMVQCYSGSFANAIFQGGDPKNTVLNRDIVGFFASTKDRVAAGCTPAVNEEYYYDFTSYFFSALTGRDRLGRRVAGDADFDRDGRTTLDEAYYWAVLNDASIDVPTAASEAFLDHVVPLQQEDLDPLSVVDLLRNASVAQRAALEGLLEKLEVDTQGRVESVSKLDLAAQGTELAAHSRTLATALSAQRAEQLRRLAADVPGLATHPVPNTQTEALRQAARPVIAQEIQSGRWANFISLIEQRDALARHQSRLKVQGARQLRALRLIKRTQQEQLLREKGSTSNRARYELFLQGEARSLLPYAA